MLTLQLMRAGEGVVPTGGRQAQLQAQQLGSSQKVDAEAPWLRAMPGSVPTPSPTRAAPHAWVLSQRALLPLLAGLLGRDFDWLPSSICSGGDGS